MKTKIYKDMFLLVTDEDKKQTSICIGNQLAEKRTFDSEKEAINFIERKDWRFLANCMCILVDLITSKKYENGEKAIN